MGLGCIMLGVSFLVLIAKCANLGDTAQISFLWLVLGTFGYTIGELYLSPIGLSLVTKVSPARLVSMMMGMWFLSSFFGNYLTGYLGMYYDRMSHTNFFWMLTVLGVLAGVAIFAVKAPLEKAIDEKGADRRVPLPEPAIAASGAVSGISVAHAGVRRHHGIPVAFGAGGIPDAEPGRAFAGSPSAGLSAGSVAESKSSRHS